mmetsp:Transcript_3745/g.5793  ORF Transcript_3745/g.5793 Transcript_3745/m.5793 type:complete len:219 (+) Transcript_3745:2732-3388(+)
MNPELLSFKFCFQSEALDCLVPVLSCLDKELCNIFTMIFADLLIICLAQDTNLLLNLLVSQSAKTKHELVKFLFELESLPCVSGGVQILSRHSYLLIKIVFDKLLDLGLLFDLIVQHRTDSHNCSVKLLDNCVVVHAHLCVDPLSELTFLVEVLLQEANLDLEKGVLSLLLNLLTKLGVCLDSLLLFLVYCISFLGELLGYICFDKVHLLCLSLLQCR